MAGVVARRDAAAADAVAVRRQQSGARFNGLHRRHFGFVRVRSVVFRLLFACGLNRRFRLRRCGVPAAALRRRVLRAADGAVRVHGLCRARGFTDAYRLRLLFRRSGRVLARGKGRRGQKGQRHAQRQQDGRYSFSHSRSSLVSYPFFLIASFCVWQTCQAVFSLYHTLSPNASGIFQPFPFCFVKPSDTGKHALPLEHFSSFVRFIKKHLP